MTNQPNNSQPFNYDAQMASQEKAVEQINAIANAHGMKYILVCNEDFYTATNSDDESEALPYTNADCELFKQEVLDAMMEHFYYEVDNAMQGIISKYKK